MTFIVEIRKPGGKWERYGAGSSRRTAEIAKASATREFPQAEVRIRKGA